MASSKSSTDSTCMSSMNSAKQQISSSDEQQEISSDTNNVTLGVQTITPSSIAGSRSEDNSPSRSYALIETDPTELDRIIDLLRQFFPNTRIIECNNSSSNPSRSPLATSPQQQTSIESNSSLSVPTSSTIHHRSQSQSISEKSSFESDILQNSAIIASETINYNFNDKISSSTNSQAFKGKVKDYLQRRYLEQINEHKSRKETFIKCRSDDLNYSCIKREASPERVQSYECISKPKHHYHPTCSNSFTALLTTCKSGTTEKTYSFDASPILLQHSVSDTNLCCTLSVSDSKLNQSQNEDTIHSQSKHGLLRRCATIDMEESPTSKIEDEPMTSLPTSPIIDEKTDRRTIIFSTDRPTDDDRDQSPKIQSSAQLGKQSHTLLHSYSDQQITEEFSSNNNNNNDNNLLIPCPRSFEQPHKKKAIPLAIPSMPFATAIGLPPAPYSASSDPGPYHSPWSNTPTNPYGLVNFHFPKTQKNAAVNAQGSITQLSTLTKFFCDEPSLCTPITPRFTTETQDSNTSINSSSVPPCQICRRQFESRQMYLAHYRTHLELSRKDDKSSIHEYSRANDIIVRPGIRNYSCKICSKRFSRSDMLNRHQRLHSGVRPYRCTMCNQHFSRSDHLSTHLRTHTGEKPYTCPECSYAACRRDMITRHLKVHSKQRFERKNATPSLGSSNEP